MHFLTFSKFFCFCFISDSGDIHLRTFMELFIITITAACSCIQGASYHHKGRMNFMNGAKKGEDVRKCEYQTNMEVAKLGRKQSAGESSTAVAAGSAAIQPQITRKLWSRSTVPFLGNEKKTLFPSLLDFYINESKAMRPRTLFDWATSPDHCRNLLRILGTGDEPFVENVLGALQLLRSDRVTQLTTHSMGQHFGLKLLEVANEDQCLKLVKIVTKAHSQLITIACTSKGKGLVQKMIKMFQAFPTHLTLMLSNLEHDTLTLATNREGQSIVYTCLRFLNPLDCAFIFETLLLHFLDVIESNKSQDGFGGVIMVRHCLKKAPEDYQQLLMEKVADHTLSLSKHPVGHYLVLDLLNNSKWVDVSRKLVRKLQGNLAHHAMHKISSKVVRECLIMSSSVDIGMTLESMVRELIEWPLFSSEMLENIHALSVIRTACSLSEGPLLEDLNAAIGNTPEET